MQKQKLILIAVLVAGAVVFMTKRRKLGLQSRPAASLVAGTTATVPGLVPSAELPKHPSTQIRVSPALTSARKSLSQASAAGMVELHLLPGPEAGTLEMKVLVKAAAVCGAMSPIDMKRLRSLHRVKYFVMNVERVNDASVIAQTVFDEEQIYSGYQHTFTLPAADKAQVYSLTMCAVTQLKKPCVLPQVDIDNRLDERTRARDLTQLNAATYEQPLFYKQEQLSFFGLREPMLAPGTPTHVLLATNYYGDDRSHLSVETGARIKAAAKSTPLRVRQGVLTVTLPAASNPCRAAL